VTITRAQLVAIFERTSTLAERLSPRLLLDESQPIDDAAVARRVARWCHEAAGDDWERFDVLLAARGLDLQQVRRKLGAVCLAANETLPRWLDTFERIVGRLESQPWPSSASIFDPFVSVAREQLSRRAGHHAERLAPACAAAWEDHLRERLAEAAGATLALKFDAFRASGNPFATARVSWADDDRLAARFRQRLLAGEWLAVVRDFPVLARVLATLTDCWVDAVAEFLRSLHDDLPAIEAAFSTGASGRVVLLRPGLSDPHHGGRTVVHLTFESGLDLFFKPKDVGMEHAWSGLLAWINREGWTPRFRVLTVLPRHGHGWVGAAGPALTGTADRSRWHYLAGALLCLLHVMDATDVLRDNVVDEGTQPALVDLETLMQPHVRLEGPEVSRRFTASVLRTRFLPEWTVDGSGRLRWIGGMDVTPVADQSQVADGFRAMHRFLRDRKAALLGPGSPMRAFADRPLRPIFQDTAVYTRARRRSLEPSLLREGVDRSIALEHLYRLPLATRELPAFMPRCTDEIRALERLDIPCFEAVTTSTELRLEGAAALPDHFVEAPLTRVLVNIAGLNDDDLTRQLALADGAFCFKTAALGGNPAQPDAGAAISATLPQDAGTHERLVGTARRIAAEIDAAALHTEHGASWAIPERMPLGGGYAYRFVPSDLFLYSGNCGVALFLAAVRATLEDDTGGLLRATLRPVLAFIQTPVVPPHVTIGATTGLSSIVYALATIGQLTHDPATIQAALNAADLLTAERIHADRRLDVYDGSAGATLALLSLYRTTGERGLLSRAISCGDHLLASRTRSGSGHRVWATLGGRHISGLAHGTAGIALALLRLFRASADARFLDAAAEAFAFEATTFSPDQNNWRSFGSAQEQPVFRTAICHGAAGIGLTRLAALPDVDSAEIRADIRAATRSVSPAEHGDVDSLCCGNAGRLTFLSAVAHQLEAPELRHAAMASACHLVRAAESAGSFRLQPDLPRPVANAGFFRGSAGVGYELLRLAFPGRLPCVPMFD
jgi:lantibiotic modifying enzyme